MAICSLHERGLTIPHPRMHERAFVLLPLAEIAPRCVIPGRGDGSRIDLRAIDAAVSELARLCDAVAETRDTKPDPETESS